MNIGRLGVAGLAALTAFAGIGTAVAVSDDDDPAGTPSAIEMRKDDLAGEVFVEQDEGDDGTKGDDGVSRGDDTGDRDSTRGNDGTRGGDNTGDRDATRGNDGTRGGDNTGDGDATYGNDGTAGGDNTYVAAPAPAYGDDSYGGDT